MYTVRPTGTTIQLGDYASGVHPPLSPPYGNRFRPLWKPPAMTPQSYAKMIARQHGIILTNDEANCVLWNRTPYPMIGVAHPMVTKLLRMEFADLERFELWWQQRGLVIRILERAEVEVGRD